MKSAILVIRNNQKSLQFIVIPNEYQELTADDIEIPAFTSEDIPEIELARVWQLLTKLETNKATATGDFPVKLSKLFAAYLAAPLCHIINSRIRRGEYPNLCKFETPIPVPKHHLPKSTSNLKNISGLLTR